jgi:hypothetical protein
MLDYIDVNKLKTHFPDVVWHIPPETTCIWLMIIYEREIEENGVRASTDPTHLGLNDRPFVPHILYPVIGALFL